MILPSGKQADEAAVDRRRGLGGELLKDDGANERGEMIDTKGVGETAGPMFADQRRHDRIAAQQPAARVSSRAGSQTPDHIKAMYGCPPSASREGGDSGRSALGGSREN